MMDNESYQQLIDQEIEKAMAALFPHGAGHAPHTRVEHWLRVVAQYAFGYGRSQALLGVMTSQDVAEHFDISHRRARALIKNRHERFGVGMLAGNQWLIHRDELPEIEPDERYRQK